LKAARYLLGAVRTSLVEYYTWFLFIGIYIVTGIFVPYLFRSATLSNVLVQGTTVCLLSIGMAFVMLVGEIDLSIVAVAAFSPMAGILSWEIGFPIPAAILLTLLIGCGVGLFNGLMITKLKIPSLVQTVAMWWILEGIVLIVTRGVAKAGLPDMWMLLGRVFIGPIPLLVFFFLAVVIIAILFGRRTVTGRRLYLVGGNREACSAMGIPVNRIRIISFMISGFFGALAGYVSSSRMGFVSASFAVEWLMPAIAAPVIAGVSLTGGRGNFVNVIAGAYLVQLIVMVVRAGGVSGYFTEFVQGLLVFIAILVNTGRQRVIGR
jgi:simple sugar transport system permease protein/ribose transport system permease protein